MSDARELWWAAGRMAHYVPDGNSPLDNRWHEALRLAAHLLEPGWPKHWSSGPFTFALPTLALLLYVEPIDIHFQSMPRDVPTEHLIATLRSGQPGRRAEDVIRAGLPQRGHDLTDSEDRLSRLFHGCTVKHGADRVSLLELPSFEQPRSGTQLEWGAEWAIGVLETHHLPDSASAH
ncbi:hypothetical protein ABZX98_12045 [Streptomyces sp. NPDC002992]|uniref:hypothetical protein n=1 Tax=Streptomyces sp. NPDC002992 TaxID=3154273 RepID=UPI0033AF74A2